MLSLKWSLSRLKIQPCLYYEWRWNPRWCLGVLCGWVLVPVAVLVRLLLAGAVKTAGDRLLLSVVVRLAGLAAGMVWRFGYNAEQCLVFSWGAFLWIDSFWCFLLCSSSCSVSEYGCLGGFLLSCWLVRCRLFRPLFVIFFLLSGYSASCATLA
jgi:hypothetical protein